MFIDKQSGSGVILYSNTLAVYNHYGIDLLLVSLLSTPPPPIPTDRRASGRGLNFKTKKQYNELPTVCEGIGKASGRRKRLENR